MTTVVQLTGKETKEELVRLLYPDEKNPKWYVRRYTKYELLRNIKIRNNALYGNGKGRLYYTSRDKCCISSNYTFDLFSRFIRLQYLKMGLNIKDTITASNKEDFWKVFDSKAMMKHTKMLEKVRQERLGFLGFEDKETLKELVVNFLHDLKLELREEN